MFIFFSDSSSASNQSSHPFAEPIDATNESLQNSVPESGENEWEYLSHPLDRRAESTSYSSNAVGGKCGDAKKSCHAKRLSSPEFNPVIVLVSPDESRLTGLVFGSNYKPVREKFEVLDVFHCLSEEKLADIAHRIHICLNICGVDHSKRVILIQDAKCFGSLNICRAFNKASQLYFVDRYALQYMPSVKILKRFMDLPPSYVDVSVDVNSPREVVLMFNSDIRQAEISSPSSTCCEEMASLCSLKFRTQPVLGTYASKRLFCSRAASAKVVILNVPVESSSGSLIFESSTLTPEDVRNLRMTAALVVLPPCLSDDGLSKMTAAFLAAGAQSVLTCPQSAITSESHSTFFDYFINFLLSGDSSVCALRRAQISLRCILEFSDPIFWSDYRIVGRDVRIKVTNSVDATALIKCIGLPGAASDQSCLVSIQKNIADSAETTNIQVSPPFMYCSENYFYLGSSV